MSFIKEIVDYVCETKAGYGAFREFAELIIAFKNNS
jgi:3-deoxy-D-manno-octulosonate 8-phosphate phosphatase KdsC-like HAD superfamily phosphatase